MIIKEIRIANALKTLSDECRTHDYCHDCPLYVKDTDMCFMNHINKMGAGLEYLKVKQHGDNEYLLSIG